MKPGRPPIAPEIVVRVLELRKVGLGYGKIARELGIGRTSVRRVCQNSRVQEERVLGGST